MAYSKTVWVDNSTPALDAAHLNNIENGIYDLDSRLTTAEYTISTHTSSINTNTQNIETNTEDIADINLNLEDAIIIREGSFTGSWSPSIISTFGIYNYNDYNWTINIIVPSRTTSNGKLLIQEAFISGSAITLTSTYDGVGLPTKYRLVGTKKTISNYAILNQA
jgi:hypothetical protein